MVASLSYRIKQQIFFDALTAKESVVLIYVSTRTIVANIVCDKSGAAQREVDTRRLLAEDTIVVDMVFQNGVICRKKR